MLNLGVIGYSSIAKRSVIPALMQGDTGFKLAGIASCSKFEQVKEEFSSIITEDKYEDLIHDPNINAYYVSLPPGKNFEVVQMCLTHGKHVYCEKPITLCSRQSEELFLLARRNNVVLVEGYMYFHSKQFQMLEQIIETDIGEIKFIHSSFTIPLNDPSNFRYDKHLGGGGIYDTCGYPLSLILYFMRNDISIKSKSNTFVLGTGVVESGMAFFAGENCAASICYGLNKGYSCSVQIVGELGSVHTNRIFTARPNQVCSFQIFSRDGVKNIEVIQDDHFHNAFAAFYNTITYCQAFKGHNPLVMSYIEMLAND